MKTVNLEIPSWTFFMEISALLPPNKKCSGIASVRCAIHRPFWPVQPALESPHLLPMGPQGPQSLPE